MFFGLTIEKLILIGVVAALLIGPERLPRYAEALGRFTRRSREYLQGAKTRVQDEMGPEFDDVDWKKLDPRQYDPRRIIREALLDDPPTATVKAVSSAAILGTASESSATSKKSVVKDGAFPFDDEAT